MKNLTWLAVRPQNIDIGKWQKKKNKNPYAKIEKITLQRESMESCHCTQVLMYAELTPTDWPLNEA